MIGPEPGNATLTSNTASAVPVLLENEYDFTSVKLNDFTASALLSSCPILVPLFAAFKSNCSFCTNVPITSLRYPI